MKTKMSKSEEIAIRAIKEAEFIIRTKCTIRECSKAFGVGKSTTHKDIIERLPKINKSLFDKVYPILKDNFRMKHIRGGNSTKNKYKLGVAA